MAAPQPYLLQDLLKVRRLREDAAARAWARQKEVVAAAQSELAKQRDKLEQYKQWRVKRENELFNTIIDKTIQPKKLEDLRFQIQRLRDKQADLESQALETEKRLQEEKQKLEETKEHYHEAFRQREKLDEHKAAWVIEAAREQERREETELEDLTHSAGPLALMGA